MKIKKLLSFAAACAMAVTSLTGAITVSAESLEDIFTFTDKGTYYQVKPKDKTLTSYNVPSEYNGKPVDAYQCFYLTHNIEEAVVPDVVQTEEWLEGHTPYRVVISSSSVKRVQVNYTGSLRLDLFTACSALEDVYLYCNSLTLTSSFSINNPNCVYHVINDDVKTALVEAGISDDKVVLMSLDYSELNEAISNAGKYQEIAYTADSYKALSDAVAAGNAVKANSEATQGDVDAAAKAINDAIANLKPDYTVLNEAITAGEAIDTSIYTGATVTTLTNAIAAGKAVLANTEATATDISNAVTAINDAIAGLVDLTALKTAIANGEAIDKSIYTEATVTTLTNAITAGKAVLANTEATATDVSNAVTAINDAINGLQRSYPITYDVSANQDGSVILKLNEDGSVVISGSGAMKNYSSEYSGGAAPWYNDGYYTQFKSVTIEDGVTSVGNYAFNMCSNLTSLTIADGVTSVGEYAFNQCSNLTTLTIADSVTSIGASAFRYCGLTGDVIVPEGVTVLSDVVFGNNTSADLNIYVKGKITKVGKNPFLLCAGKIYVYDGNTYNLVTGTSYGTAEIIYDGEIDTSDLEAAIAQAEALNESDYTAATWATLASALESAKTELANEEKTSTSVLAATTAITNAINGLIEEGKYMAYIYSGGTQTTIASGSVIGKMAGATAVKVNFDCASDTSYNPNAAIDFLINNDWNNNYEFKGTYSYENGTTGCNETIELSSALIKGDSFTLSGYTYSWGGASDYVYAVTSVEFLDAEGKTLYTMTSATAEYEKAISALETAISKAETLDTANYTDESVAVLTAAIEAAKALTEEATVEEINAAATAIEDAVKGLVEKPAPTEPDPTEPDPTKPDPTNPEPSKPTTKTPTTAATKVTATTRSAAVVAKDKAAAEKVMKQAKIKKLTVKSKAKKKITVTWKKVKKAVGYEVQVSTNKKFKKSKIIIKKLTSKKKLTIKNKKIKSGKKYYVRVRAYATYKNANGTAIKVYSNWNKKLRTVKVK